MRESKVNSFSKEYTHQVHNLPLLNLVINSKIITKKVTYSIEVRAQRVFCVPSLAEGLLVGTGHVVGLGLIADRELSKLAEC